MKGRIVTYIDVETGALKWSYLKPARLSGEEDE
jgi:hypothetical protein